MAQLHKEFPGKITIKQLKNGGVVNKKDERDW